MALDDPHIWRTAISAWPQALTDMALPCDSIALPAPDLAAILHTARGAGGLVLSDDLASGCAAILAEVDQGAHLRFDLCSAKQGPLPPRLTDLASLHHTLNRANTRLATVLAASQTTGRDEHLYFYPWVDIPRWSEFRLFIHNRTVVGVSQYHTGQVFAEITRHYDELVTALVRFAPPFLDALHLGSVVADVFFAPAPSGSFETRLIELNPFVRRTDPCLYSWENGGNFDRGIRYLG